MTWESQEERDALADDRARELWVAFPRPCGAAESEGDDMSDRDRVEYWQGILRDVQAERDELRSALAARDETIQQQAQEIERLRSLLRQAGLQCFLSKGTPEGVAAHLESVAASHVRYEKKQAQRITDSAAQCDTLRNSVDELARANQTLIAQMREQARRIKELEDAWTNMRDSILHERHQIAEMDLESEQINAILDVIDDAYLEVSPSPLPPKPQEDTHA